MSPLPGKIPKSNRQIPRGAHGIWLFLSQLPSPNSYLFFLLRVFAARRWDFFEGEDENDAQIVICPGWKVDSGAGDAGYFYAWHGFMTW